MSVIVTTRFTSDTWRENTEWRKIRFQKIMQPQNFSKKLGFLMLGQGFKMTS